MSLNDISEVDQRRRRKNRRLKRRYRRADRNLRQYPDYYHERDKRTHQA